MYQVKLSPEETEVLSQVLQNAVATLELEIQHTDHQDFKNLLKQRRETLQTLIARVPQPAASAA